MKDIRRIIEEEQKRLGADIRNQLGDITGYKAELNRLEKKKERAYEDYSDGIITRDEYLKYKSGYERQINSVHLKIEMINQAAKDQSFVSGSWIDRLLQDEPLDHLDRETVVEMLSMIHVYENHSIRIAYNFSDELEALLDNRDDAVLYRK